MRVGSLFAGIGGFDLGLSWAGYDIVWQVELNEWCRKVLAKHWPDATRFADIRDCGLHNLEPVDVICGGFPCTDISLAGKQAGLNGEQSSLWWEMRRIVGELRPRYVIVENVPNLLIRGFDRVLGSLSEIGYDAEWDVISAHDVGAPHLRQRLWIVAYPCGSKSGVEEHSGSGQGRQSTDALPSTLLPCGNRTPGRTGTGTGGAVAYPTGARGEAWDGDGLGTDHRSRRHQGVAAGQGGEGGAAAVEDTTRKQLEERIDNGGEDKRRPHGQPTRSGTPVAHAIGPRLEGHPRHGAVGNECGRVASGPDGSVAPEGLCERTAGYHPGWVVEPDVGRVANGVSKRVDRLRGLGNAIVPQIAYWLGTRIKDAP